MNFPNKKYSVIYADPPWSYGDKGFGKRNGGADSAAYSPESGRYQTMPIGDVCALPIQAISERDCALLLWATSPLLPESLQVISAWGFKFKTVAFVWSKMTSTGKEVANLGQWTLGNVEMCLLATKGSPKRIDRTVRQLITAERTRHSAKPIEARDRIERIFGAVPRIELFARESVPGWDCWGNEVAEAKTERE